MLGIGGGAMVALACFGGYGLDLPYRTIAERGRFVLLLTDRETPDAGAGLGPETRDRFRFLRASELAARDLDYPDLVGAADVVVSKPGYGIVSECIANGAALLYTDRGRFAEHDVFVDAMPRVMRCGFISQRDLQEGRWTEPIESLLCEPEAPVRLETNGAKVAAETILDIASRRT